MEKIPDIAKKMMADIVGKIGCIYDTRVSDESTRRIICENRDTDILSIVFLYELYLELEYQLISEIV